MWVLCKCGLCKFGSRVKCENVNLGQHPLEVPRGRDGLCGHHGGRSLALLVIYIGNLQGVGEDRNQNEGEDTEGGGQEESDGAIARTP